jgi:S1-C subfamily serine protease
MANPVSFKSITVADDGVVWKGRRYPFKHALSLYYSATHTIVKDGVIGFVPLIGTYAETHDAQLRLFLQRPALVLLTRADAGSQTERPGVGREKDMNTMGSTPYMVPLVAMALGCSLQANAADFNALRRSLVVVESDAGSGSGFVVEIGGKRYVMTNQHVVRAARKIQLRLVDGQVLTPKALELAAEHDAVRILFESAGDPPHPLTVASTPPSIGHTVKIYGNSEGMGAVTPWRSGQLHVGNRR